MPETITESMEQTVQSFAPGDYIELFQLDTSVLGGPIFYFTPSTNGSALIFHDGIPYTPIEIKADGFEWKIQGQFPKPKMKISNVNQSIGAAAIGYRDLLGAKLNRLVTYKQFLDGETDGDPDAVLIRDTYYVERKVEHNKQAIEWELASSIDQEGKQLPGRQVLKDTCTHIYRRWDADLGAFDYTRATCPYTGTDYFTQQNSPTSAANDACGKRFGSCKMRFGQNGTLPFRGFPGVGLY